MKYKLVASDFDDTLLRSDGTVSEHTLRTIEAFQRAGGTFVVVTGRMTSSILAEARKNGLTGLVVGFGGGQVAEIESGKTIFESPLDSGRAAKIAGELEALGLQVQTYLGPDVLVNVSNEHTVAYGRACGVTPVEIGEPVSKYLKRTGARPYKVLAFAERKTVLEQVARINREYPDLFACYSKPYFIEVSNRDTNKAHALQMLADRLGIDVEQTIAVGDSNNDLPMIAYAGLGAAVANGTEAARECADFVTASNDEDGVAALIERFCLNGGEDRE